MREKSLIFVFAIWGITIKAQNFSFNFSPEVVKPSIEKVDIQEGLSIYSFTFDVTNLKKPIEISWQQPAYDMSFYWTTGSQGGLKPDWNSWLVQSHATSQAPVYSVTNNANINRLTVAASDGLNMLNFYLGVVEETASIINRVSVSAESFRGLTKYKLKLRIDSREIPYWLSLKEVGEWWASSEIYKPTQVPEAARQPMYSTWYSFHQQLATSEVIRECKIAKTFGCHSVIIDDGWQTLDNNRGYKFTGDWKPERIPDMKAFVDSIHTIGMKFILWYSVPFVGSESKAYKQFEGKFLKTKDIKENAILDPRYPEVREFLINTYVDALKNWGLDGFKLDFVDNFQSSRDMTTYTEGMDYRNIDDATDRLLTDVTNALKAINSDILIEFRQSYIGPLMRKYGNMLRATDCPYSILDNRVRTVKIRLLSGNTAVHSDMIMWHPSEPAEVAALQLLNVMFSVPQISIKMHKYPVEHTEMLKFWVPFWIKNRDALLDGTFEAWSPDNNFLMLIGKTQQKMVAGVYAPNILIPLATEGKPYTQVSIINATDSEDICLDLNYTANYRYVIYNCLGKHITDGDILKKGLYKIKVPKSGLIELHLK